MAAQTEADKARKTAESVSRERDLMAQQLRTIEERHAGVVQAAKDAEQRAEQEQQRLQKELQVAQLSLPRRLHALLSTCSLVGAYYTSQQNDMLSRLVKRG